MAPGLTAWLRQLESPRGQYAVLALLTLLAAGLRFYRLGDWSFWVDELYFIRRAQRESGVVEIIAYWPPVSIILTGATLRQLGVTEWSARLIPALIGTISIPVLYFPVRRLLGHRTALIAMLLLALSTWHLFWSQNARFYTFLMLVYALASLAFFFAMERNRLWLIVLFYVLLLVALRERFLALLLVPVVVSYLLCLRILPFDRPPGFRPSALVPLLVFGSGLLLYDAYNWTSQGYSQIVEGLRLYYPEPAGDPIRLLTHTAFDIGIPLVALALFGGLYTFSQRNRTGLFLVLGAVVPVGALLLMNPLLFTDPRYAFVTLPSWIMLAAIAIEQLTRLTRGRETLLALGVLAVVVADSSGTNLLYFRAYHGNRLDWKGAFGVARENSREGDAFVAWWPEFGPYYLGKEVLRWDDVKPVEVVRSGRRYWFIMDSERHWSNPTLKEWLERNGRLIDVRYLRTPRDAWLRVYLYDPAHQAAGR